jgi:2-(1,2-epoxy-1,2-dihydrophenyl)acetyl-CoA isomerase
MAESSLLIELKNGVYTLTLSRPKANAFDDDLIGQLQGAFREAKKNSEIRSILLRANGKLFSAGQDVSALGGEGTEVSFLDHLRKNYNPLIKQMRELEKPILGAINGATAGAALGIALACDMRIASENARFVVGFGGIALAPDSAVSLMLPLIIGLGRASQATFFNQPIDAQQALSWGLVNEVVSSDELGSAAEDWAQRLADGPVQSMGLSKRAFNRALLPHLEEILEYEAQNQQTAGSSAEHKEGVAAFLGKRAPKYRSS